MTRFGTDAGQRADAGRGGVARGGHLHRKLEQVGLHLHEQARAGQAAVDAQPGQRPAEISGDGACQQGDLGRQTLHGGPDHVSRLRGGADPLDAGEDVGLPPRSSEAAECGDHHDLTRVGNRRGHRIEILGPGQKAPAHQPGDGGAGGIHLSVDAVHGVVTDLPAHGDGEAGRRGERVRTGVGQKEGAGAVGAFRVSGLEAVLTDERRLLVDAQPRQRERRAEGIGVSDLLGAADDSGKLGRTEAEQRAGFFGPAAASQVEQQRSRCCGDVRDVGPGETVHQPGVARGHDTPENALPPEPRHLRRREVGVERQAGDPGQRRSVLGQVGTDRGGTAILPGDGCTQRLTRRVVPGQHGLTLVGEADGGHTPAGTGDRFAAGPADRVPQLLGVLLDTAAGDGVRRDRRLDRAQAGAVVVEDHRLCRRRPLIESEDADAGSLCQGDVSTRRPPPRLRCAFRRDPPRS